MCVCKNNNCDDRQPIIKACLDYVEGFYEKSRERIEKGVHTELVKRRLKNNTILEMNREELVQIAMQCEDDPKPEIKVTVFHINDNLASAVVISDYCDYVHLAKFEGAWQVVNVLWGLPITGA